MFRDGNKQTLTVQIGELSEQAAEAPQQDAVKDLGLSVSNLTPDAGQVLGYEGTTGLLVTAVDPLRPAARAGIHVDDLIVDVQGQAVRSTSQFWEQIRKHDLKRGIRLIVRSGSNQRFVFLRSVP